MYKRQENPIDPFTGKPFDYALTENGFELSSPEGNNRQRNERLYVLVEQLTWETYRKQQEDEDEQGYEWR